jgi:glycosyltransferase involved in cell wall biosynthesis
METLPKISIVTPSFNQARYLEATIQSVLRQGYARLEYIVVDGGSTDGSVDIIRKYESRIAYWVSEPDRGQAHAIAKGMCRTSGDILAWLNSDDTYEPGTLDYVGRFFAQNADVDILYGNYNRIDAAGAILERKRQPRFHAGIAKYVYCMLMQPATFWRAGVYERVGGIDPTFQFAMDYELFLRMIQAGRVAQAARPLANFRIHETSKTSTLSSVACEELRRIRARYCAIPPGSPLFPVVTGWYWANLTARMLVEGCLYEKIANQARRRLGRLRPEVAGGAAASGSHL